MTAPQGPEAARRSLSGLAAVVTGGGTGIGAAITTALADLGASVVIVQPDQASAEALAAALLGSGREVHGVGEDLATARGCLSAVERSVRHLGRLDILVNNAAVVGEPARGSLFEMDDEQIDRIVDVNVKAVLRCSREAARHMRGTGGVIVNIASVGAFAAQDRATAYVATKAAVVGMTRGLAFELAPHRIRVVAVAPGDIDLQGDASMPATNPYERADAAWWERRSPLGRRGSPLDIATAVAYLVSAEASYVTGTTLVVDGGWLSY